MVPLFVLKLAYGSWKHTFALSKKLSGPTWIAFAVLNASIAATAFWASQAESVTSSAIPPIAHIERAPAPTVSLLVRHDPSWSTGAFNVSILGSNYERTLVALVISTGEYSSVYGHLGPQDGASLSRTVPLTTSPYPFAIHFHNHMLLGDVQWKIPRLPMQCDQVVLNVPPSDAPSLLTPTQQVVAIILGIFTSFIAAFNAFIAWQVYRRTKTQEILLRLQIAKIQRELADLKAQDEKARNDPEKSSLILLP